MFHTPSGRTRKVSALAAGAVLTAVTLAATPAAGQTPDLSAPARAAADVVPLAADLQVTVTAPDGTVTQEIRHYYRDSQGRTRTEAGTLVTINDPVTGTVTILDTATRTYRSVARDQAPAGADLERSAQQVPARQLSSEPQLLGRAVIEGVRAEGRTYTVTAPQQHGLSGGTYQVTRWTATGIQLPLVTRVVHPDGTIQEERYTNLRIGVEPATSLFGVPAGFREAGPASGATPAQQCPVAWISLLAMTSVGPFLGDGIVTAVTDPNLGCFFAADAAIFEYPMDGFPLWPLGLPWDEWYVYDTGLPVPFLPYTAFGFLGFVAMHPDGEVVGVESLVILDIF